MPDDRRAIVRALALVGQVGWWAVASIAGGLLLGIHLDRRLGTRFLFTVLLLLAGIAGGGWQAYRLIMRSCAEGSGDAPASR